MIFELLFKEFRLNRKEGTSSLTLFVLKLLLTLIGGGLLVALLSFLTDALYDKLIRYSYIAPFGVVCFFLFLIFLLAILEGATRARRTLFDERDRLVVSPLPISRGKRVFSKMLYVFLTQWLELSLLSLPLLITFGVKVNFPYWYHVISLVYTFILALTSMGFSFVLSLLFQVVHLYLKDRNLIQFLLSCGIVVGLCYAYQVFLNLFLVALSDGSLTGTLSPAFVSGLIDSNFYMFPVYNMLDFFWGKDNMLSNSLVILGIALLSLSAGYFAADFALSKKLFLFESKKTVDVSSFVIDSPRKALWKKELLLLFKDSSNTFSYTSVLIMLPFLSFVVLSSLKVMLSSNLSIFLTYYPTTLDALFLSLILFFAGIVNSGNALKPSAEGKGLTVTKTLPYHPMEILLVKLLCPFALSTLSLLVSLVVLISTGIVSWQVFLIGLVVGILLVFSMNLLSLLGDMHDLSDKTLKLSFLSSLVSYLLPLLELGVGLGMTFVHSEKSALFWTMGALGILLLVPLFFFRPKPIEKLYRSMEVRA